MKKNSILFILFIIVPFLFYGQELLNTKVNEVDSEGRKQGFWKVYDVNGKLKFKGNFKDDIPFGEFIYYYPGEQIKAVSYIFNNGKESRTKIYHKNGILIAEGKYLNRKKDSIWHYYSDFDGVLLSEDVYKDNVKAGVWKTFFPDGSVMEEINYKDDQKNGKWIQYYSDGLVKLKATYIDGKLQGLMTVYHLNKEVNISGTYKENLKNGVWMYFNDHAETIKKEVFDHGILISTEEYETLYK